MTVPREVLPGRFYLITRRCVQRQFLLRPDDELNNAFLYCLIEAAQRFEINLMLMVAMSNHHHTAIYDAYGRLCEFMQHFHGMLAKCVNALRGHSENCWATEAPSAVLLLEPGDVMNKLVYTATNPVKDGLVEKAVDWPGVNGLTALLENEMLTARRPAYYFRDTGPMPEVVETRLVLPEMLGDRATLLDELRGRVTQFEETRAEWRRRTGKSVLGRRRILRQSWRDSPTSNEPRGGLRPHVAGRSMWARIEALLRRREFVEAYRRAWKALQVGLRIPFPPGTYWLRRFAGVEVAPFLS